jgi:hypothetical protein
MAKYLFAYHGGGRPQPGTEQQVMEEWIKWFGELGPAIVDGGQPVGGRKTVGSDGSVSDGGGNNPVTGYSVVEGDSLDAAAEMAKGSPQLKAGGTVEVAELFDPTQMG